MATQAILFGGVGTLLECSEIQRASFNEAFTDVGLGWHWELEDYRAMLSVPGGTDRILSYAEQVGEASVDGATAVAIHIAKTRHFHARLREGGLSARPGVNGVIAGARTEGIALAYATTTDRITAMLVLQAIGVEAEAFDVIAHRGLVENAKPAPDVYQYCLGQLGVQPDSALAIEDSESGVFAARAAGISCIATPGDNTLDQNYADAYIVVSNLADLDKAAELKGAEALATRISGWLGSTRERAA